MRKLLTILLLTCYLASTAGVSVQWHYCMDKFQGLSLGPSESHACGKCGMEYSAGEEGACCKDEVTQFSLDDDHGLSGPASFVTPAISLPDAFVVEPAWTFQAVALSYGFLGRPPPLPQRSPAFLCVFRC